MVAETLVWADQSIGSDQQLADFSGISWTANDGTGAGSVVVNATLLPGTDVTSDSDINPVGDSSIINTGELVIGGNYTGGISYSNSALILRNIEGDGASGAGDTETVSLQLDFTTNNDSLYGNGVEQLSFWLSDIDTASADDFVEIIAYDLDGHLLPAGSITFSNVGTNITADNSASTATLDSNGLSYTPRSPEAAVQVNIFGPVGRVVIVMSNLSTGPQLIEVSDLSFETTPAENSCFVLGTLILTENGETPVEDLLEGDLVVTAGHGLLPIRWIGHRTVRADGSLAPICISRGTLGNTRDLLVSPAHRMMIADARVSVLFSEDEVLVPAKALLDGDRIYRRRGGDVTYFHILFDEHEVIFAEGVPTESLYLGETALSGFSIESRDEVLAIFPELNGRLPKRSKIARPVLNMAEAKLLFS